MSVRSRQTLLVCGAVLLLGSAGCSSSSGGSSQQPSSTAATPSPTAAAPSSAAAAAPSSAGAPIIVGVVYDSSGSASATSIPTYKAIQAAADNINKSGGVGGRPFKIVSASDGGQATNTPVAVSGLIGQGAVALLMASASPSFLQVKPAVQAAKIPAFSPINVNQAILAQPNADYVYIQGPTTAANNDGAAQALLKLGATNVAIISDDAPADQLDLPSAQASIKKAGLNLVDTVTIKSTATDTSADMARLAGKHPDGVYLKLQGGPVQAAIFNGLSQALPSVKKVMYNCGDANTKTVTASTIDGTVCMSQVTLDNPRTKAAHDVLKAALGSDFGPLEFNTQLYEGYQGLYTLAEAIKQGGGADSASIQAGFQKITKLPVSWGSPNFSVTYTATNHAGSDGTCTFSYDIFKGNAATGAWSVYQPACGS